MGSAISFLEWSPQGRIGCALDHHPSIFEPRLAELDPETFEYVEIHPTPVPSTYCSGLAWLPDGRRLTAWDAGSRAYVFEDDDHEVLEFKPCRPWAGVLSVDDAGTMIAYSEGISFAVRHVGPPRTLPSDEAGTRVVRGNKSQTQGAATPWSLVRRIYHDTGYDPFVDLSLEAEYLVIGSRKAFSVFSVSSGKAVWKSDLAPGRLKHGDRPSGSRATTLGFSLTYDIRALFQTQRFSFSEDDRFEYRTFAWDLETGRRPWRELEAALDTASVVTPLGNGSLLVGTQDGAVRLVSPEGKLMTELSVFPGKATLHLALGQDGLIAASSRFGQIATLRLSDAADA